MELLESPANIATLGLSSSIRWLVASFSMAMALVGCSSNPNNTNNTNNPKSSVSVDASRETSDVNSTSKPATVRLVKAGLQTGEPLTDKECQAFAQELVARIYAGEAGQAQELVDSDATLDVAFAGLDRSSQDHALLQLFRDTYLRGIKETNGFVPLCNRVQNGLSVKFLGVKRDNDEVAIVLRMLIEPNGFDYFRFVLARRPVGVRIVDAFVLRQGEFTTEFIRRTFQQALAAEKQRVAEKLTPEESQSLLALQQIKLMSDDMVAGRYQEYLDKYNDLPEEFKSDMTLLAFRVECAKRIGNETYFQVVSDVRNRRPNDPAIDVMCLDAYLLQKKFDEAHACLDRINQSIGPDPFLDVLDADYYLQEGKLEAAKSKAKAVLTADSSLIGAHWLLVHISLQEKDFASTCRFLERLEKEHNVELASTLTLDTYTDFVKSQEYQAWSSAKSDAPPLSDK